MNPQTDRLDEHIAIPKRPPASEAFVPEPLLDTDQAAAIMRIHPKTLQKLARRGVIHAYRQRAEVVERGDFHFPGFYRVDDARQQADANTVA